MGLGTSLQRLPSPWSQPLVTHNICASAGWLIHCLYNAVNPPIGSQSLIGMRVTLMPSHLNWTVVWVVMKSEHGGNLLTVCSSSSLLSGVLDASCFSSVLMVKTIAGNQLLCSVLGRSEKRSSNVSQNFLSWPLISVSINWFYIISRC